jgi:hypothetical protein
VAKEPINHLEMIIAVPYNIAINLHKALQDPLISKIVHENPTHLGYKGAYKE